MFELIVTRKCKDKIHRQRFHVYGDCGRFEPINAATQEDELLAKEIKACSKTHRGGAKTKSEKNKIRRDKKKAEKKAKYKK